MEKAACPYYDECHLKRVEDAAANADLIREIYCNGDPTGCKTYIRLKETDAGCSEK